MDTKRRNERMAGNRGEVPDILPSFELPRVFSRINIHFPNKQVKHVYTVGERETLMRGRAWVNAISYAARGTGSDS